MHPDGLLLTADLAVPPDLVEGSYTVDIVAIDPDVVLATSPLTLTRAAVQAGRAACRLERQGRRDEAQDRWFECAGLWTGAADPERADLARTFAGTRRGADRCGPSLADELAQDATDRSNAPALIDR